MRMRRSAVMLEHYRSKWWIDAGAVHGIQPLRGDETSVLAVLPADEETDTPSPGGEQPLGHARVAEVEQARCRVTADEGWQPDTEVRYRTVLIDVPLPQPRWNCGVTPAKLDLVRARLARSPHIREGAGDPGIDGDRFLVLAENGALTIAWADGLAADRAGARRPPTGPTPSSLAWNTSPAGTSSSGSTTPCPPSRVGCGRNGPQRGAM